MTVTDSPPERPPRPKHVPFWPVLVAIAFMIAIVISGIVSSNHARSEHLTVATSTLPPRGKTVSTTTTTTSKTSPTTVAPAKTVATPTSSDCTAANLVAAATASGQVDTKALGAVSAPQFKCASGYALARLVPAKTNEQSVTADYKLSNGAWVMINLGDVNPLTDGVPTNIAAQLTLS